MIRKLIILLLILGCALAITTEDIYDNSYALVIGINRYENIIINHYEPPFNCFEVVCKTKNSFDENFDYKRHLIDNKYLDKVVSHLVRNKKWGNNKISKLH